MKKLIIAILTAGILAACYITAFGVPDRIAQALNVAPEGTEAAPGGGAPRGPRGPGRTTTVVFSPLEQSPYTLTLRAVGSAVSYRSADVIAAEDGEVVETNLEANSLVEKGDVILRLDDRSEQLDLEIAIANRDQAQATVDRYKGLHNLGSTVVTDVALSEAEIALRLAEANVGLAEVALADRTVTAPFSGRLGLSDVTVGDHLSGGEVIVTIDDSTTLLAEFEVPERSIGLLAKGKPVSVSTPTYAGRVFEGKITAFDSRLDSVTRSATVQAEIDNSDGLLISGMTFSTRMFEQTDPLPTVPSTAITWDRSGAGIWVEDEGRTSRIPVTIRYREGDRVWIETDAPLGAQVVVEGAAKLRDGSQVQAAPAARGEGA